jgi:uncharacterized membrane protein
MSIAYPAPAAPPAATTGPNLSPKHLTGRARAALAENTGVTVAAYLAFVVGTQAAEVAMIFGGDESVLLRLASAVVAPALTVGWYRVLLRSLRGEAAAFSDVISGLDVFGRAIGVSVLSTVVIALGFVAFIVPGVIAALALWPALFLLADGRGSSVIGTLRDAAALTSGHRLRLLGVAVFLLVLLFFGLLFFFVGVFIAASLATVIMAAAYDEMVAYGGIA